MNLVNKLIGNGLAAALDFCFGALVATLVMLWYGLDSSYLAPFIGGLLALAPDIDLPSQFAKKGVEVDHHRSPFHYPILTVPTGVTVALLIGGIPWAIIAGVCLAGHYIHDMTGPYGGLVALWPFTQDSFSFTNGREKIGQSKREKYIRDVGHTEWIRTFWLRPSTLSMPELAMSYLFACITCMANVGTWWILVICTSSVIAAAIVWPSNLREQ